MHMNKWDMMARIEGKQGTDHSDPKSTEWPR